MFQLTLYILPDSTCTDVSIDCLVNCFFPFGQWNLQDTMLVFALGTPHHRLHSILLRKLCYRDIIIQPLHHGSFNYKLTGCRCPYESCKSCCAKAQNPCHIHGNFNFNFYFQLFICLFYFSNRILFLVIYLFIYFSNRIFHL